MNEFTFTFSKDEIDLLQSALVYLGENLSGTRKGIIYQSDIKNLLNRLIEE